MRVVCISDTHTQHHKLELPEGDMLIHAGDWTHRGSEYDTIDFLKWFEDQEFLHRIFIAGNHDFYPERYPEKFEELLEIHAPTSVYLQDDYVTIILPDEKEFKIHGSPVSPWFCDWSFNCRDDIADHWRLIPDDVDVLITHTPPRTFGDRLGPRGSHPYQHIGCPLLLNELHRLKKLKLLVCGHIHEGYGLYSKEELTIVNACVLDDRYKLKNKPIMMEL